MQRACAWARSVILCGFDYYYLVLVGVFVFNFHNILLNYPDLLSINNISLSLYEDKTLMTQDENHCFAQTSPYFDDLALCYL